ncbi:MAG: excinuclease ABC subunit B, partial [Thermotogae bacterium]
YNKRHGITPETIVKPLEMQVFEQFMDEEKKELKSVIETADSISREDYMALLEEEMYRAASELRYEDAARLRDELFKLKEEMEGEDK